MLQRLVSATTVGILTLAAATCADRSVPTQPTPSFTPTGSFRPPPPYGPTGSFRLVGVVFETTAEGRRPVSGIRVDVDVSIPNRWYYFGKATTDDSGRYSFSDLPAGLIHAWAFLEGYAKPCITSVDLRGDSVLDIELISAATLLLPNPPSLSTSAGPTLSGLVFEATPDGDRPMKGVKLSLEIGDGRGVTTYSNAEGHYSFCRVPEFVEVYAEAPGYANWSARVRVPEDTELNIELKRR